jgi:hypothetical protein
MSDDSANLIRAQMREIRGAMRENAETLVDNVRLSTDWRHYVSKHPWISMGGAALVGYLLVPKGRKVVLDKASREELQAAVQQVNASKEGPGLLTQLLMPILLKGAMAGGTALSTFIVRKFAHQPPSESEEEAQDEHAEFRRTRPR